MRVIQKPQNAGERVVALGTFDGVHRGHRALLLTAKQLADELNVPPPGNWRMNWVCR